jgi:hypothetical protein
VEAADRHVQDPIEPLAADPFVERVMGAVRSQQKAVPRWWPFRKANTDVTPDRVVRDEQPSG